MQNVLLLTVLAITTACGPKLGESYSLELEKKYPQSSFLVASSVENKLHEPKVQASASYTVGKEKTVYAKNALLTVSNEKEQIISLPYVQSNKDIKLGYEEPKSIKELAKGSKTNKVKFVEIDKKLVYPLQYLKQLPNEYYLPQEELITDKEVVASDAKSDPVILNNAVGAPAYFVMVGDVYIGLKADLSLAQVYYLRHGLEYIRIYMNDTDLPLVFTQLSKTKKTALSENNYSIIFLGKNGNTLQFRKVYNNSDKPSEYREVKMSSPQIDVFGHKLLVQTATREALHCIIQK